MASSRAQSFHVRSKEHVTAKRSSTESAASVTRASCARAVFRLPPI